MRLRGWHKNGLVCGLSCALAFLVGECVARLVWESGSETTVIRADPTYGWALLPGARLHSVDSDRGLDYHIRVNALGLRDRERTRRHPPGIHRVLFIGDSMVFGAGVEAGERCSERLEARLGPDVEVVNAGVGGWGVDQEFLYLTREGFDLQPDAVVLGLCLENDVLNDLLPHELFGTAPKPRFVLRDGRLVLEPAPPRSTPTLGWRLRLLLRHSRLLVYVARHLAELRPAAKAVSNAAAAGGMYFPENLETDSSHWSVFRRTYTPRFEAAFQVTERLIAAMQESCAARGVPLVILAFPQKVEVEPEARDRELRHYGYDPAQFDLAAPYARLRILAESLGVPFVYPLEAYRDTARRTPPFFARDGHPNAAGQALAAAALEVPVRAALAHLQSVTAGQVGQDP